MRNYYDIAELVARVKKKDLLAMQLLYNHLAKAMLTLSFRITQSLEDSEDILQESFLTSFQQIQGLKDATKYPSWLKRIVVNNSLKTIKNKQHFELIDQIELPEETEDHQWYQNISFERINSAINQLPNGCREIFTLYLLEGYKHREIAELLQISLSTSKSQYRYALKLMKEKLIKYR